MRQPIEPLESRTLLTVTLASQSTAGVAADAGAGAIGATVMNPAVSDDGRFVVFVSESANLVGNDANNAADVFVRDRTTNETRLVSVAPDGSPGNAASGNPGGGTARTGYAISGNGRYVVFASDATNLIDGQTDGNNLADLFVRDLQTNTTALVTATPAGGYSIAATVGGATGRPAVSDDGRYIAFTSTFSDLDQDANDPDDNAADVFVRDTTAGTTRQFTRTFDGEIGTGSVGASPSISSDGRYVAFTSDDKLVASPPGFIFEQVWVYDTTANSVVNASVGPDGTTFAGADNFLPQISGDGRSVVFLSSAADLVSGFVDNNGDGGGANGVDAADVFLRDLDTNVTTLVSHNAVSATAGASDLVRAASVSADGRFVAYVSRAKNLVSGVTDTNDDNGNVGGEDVFFFDATTGQTKILSLNAAGTATGAKPSLEPDGAPQQGPAMSDDGRYVVFASEADDLVANDANVSGAELFVRDTQANTTRRVYDGSAAEPGSIAVSPAIAGNGSAVAFVGNAPGLAAVQQVFVDDQAGAGGGGNNEEELGSLVPTLFTELPEAAVSGARVKGATALVTITNVDPETFNGPVTLTLFTSQDLTLDTNADAEIMRVTKKLRIDSGQAKTLRLRIAAFPQVADGNYVIFARVSSETAGTGSSTNDDTINIAAPFVDLVGTEFDAFPEAGLTRGKRGRLSLKVLNRGNVNAKGTVPVAIALSSDPAGGSPATVATVNAKVSLKPGASRTVRLNFTLPADAATGAFYVVATIDPNNVLAEKNELNNAIVSPVTVTVA